MTLFWKGMDTNRPITTDTIRNVVAWFREQNKKVFTNKEIKENLFTYLQNKENASNPSGLVTWVHASGLINKKAQVLPLLQKLIDRQINEEEYSLIYLSKLGVYEYNDAKYLQIVFICKYLEKNNFPPLNADTLLKISRYKDYSINQEQQDKGISRGDLLLNALNATGLFIPKKQLSKKALSEIEIKDDAKEIIKSIAQFGENMTPPPNYSSAQQDDKQYSFYGDLEHGIFEILDKVHSNSFKKFFPNLGKSSFMINAYQKIFFGAPGTGKSHKIDYNLFKDKDGNLIGTGIKEIPEDRKFRTTFHPDYDYAQFVGAYKPKKELNNTTNKEELTYSFVPQVFAKAYAAAWKLYLAAGNASTADNQVYLVIEEINRGNCAQIFGDIFQLLDRNSNDFSSYSIDIDSDFADWLRTDSKDGLQKVWNEYINFRYKKDDEEIRPVSETKIALPPNLNILATMNTSDQSLFPMDSAFKRRFDWEYVPIKYKKDDTCGAEWNADQFVISVGDSCYHWLEFLEKVNKNVYKVTKSEDKQMGEFFIKHSVDYKEFRSKVLFYLWDSVYKDEEGNKDAEKVFHFKLEGNQDKTLTFQTLFEGSEVDQKDHIAKIMSNLDVVDQNAPRPQQGEQGANDPSAEPAPAEEPNPAQ